MTLKGHYALCIKTRVFWSPPQKFEWRSIYTAGGDDSANDSSFWQPSYSLYSEFCLFPKLKEFMKWQKFIDDEDVIHTASG